MELSYKKWVISAAAEFVPPERTLNAAVCPEILSWICVAKHRPVTGLGGTSKGRFGVYRKFLQVGGHTLLGWDMF